MNVKVKSRIVLLLVFCFFLFASSTTSASETKIRVTGLDYPRTRHPLVLPGGRSPVVQTRTLQLYWAITDKNNFGPEGTVKCSIDFKTTPHVTELSEGYLVDMFGNLKADMFFVGYIPRFVEDITEVEAQELARFIRAGGVVYLGGDGKLSSDVSPYNQLFFTLGIKDRYRREQVLTGGAKQTSNSKVTMSVTAGPFGEVGKLKHTTFRKIDLSFLNSLYLSEDLFDTIVVEKEIGQGLLVSTGSLLHAYEFMVDPDNRKFFLNLFASACNRKTSVGSITPVAASTEALTVPLFKQGIAPYSNGDPFWEGQEYDSGNSQSLGCGSTIAQCGCVTTDVAMLLKYYGIDKSPDGITTTPASVNSYFNKDKKCGSGGCISRGYSFGAVRWGAVAQYSKEANAKYGTQKIVWNGAGAHDVTIIKNDLEAKRPVILQQPGHFVIATGVDGDTFNINDPFYNRTKLVDYNNTSLGLRRFKETNSDFSMIEIAARAPAQLMVIAPDGKRTGYDNSSAKIYTEIAGSSYLFEQSVVDPTGVQAKPGVKAGVYTAIVPTPSNGSYEVRIISPVGENYSVAAYFSETDADTSLQLLEGLPESGTQHIYKFTYNTDLGVSNLIQETIELDIKKARVWKNGNGKDKFEIKGSLSTNTLVSGTSGDVAIKFGDFEATIPRSEFKTYTRMKRGTIMALFNYNSIRSIHIYENGKYKIVGENVNLDNLSFPGNATFRLGVGDVEVTSGLSFNKRGRI